MEKKFFFFLTLPKDNRILTNPLTLINSKVGSSCEAVGTYNLPRLRYGTLDSLMSLSDDINKVDLLVGGICRKVGRQFVEITAGTKEEPLRVRGEDIVRYVCKFEWDTTTYPPSLSLRDLMGNIANAVTQLENNWRSAQQEYLTFAQQMAALERKSNSNLLTRPIGEVVPLETLTEF